MKTKITLLQLNHAAGLLAVHGVITHAERRRIHQRLMKRKAKQEGATSGSKP